MPYKVDPSAKYSPSHEWVRIEGGVAVVGVSDYAQHQLSDVVYVELPEVGDVVEKGGPIATAESVKAAEEVYSPVSGTVVAINEGLADRPQALNEDPYGDGWLVKLQPTDLADLDDLMDATAYEAYVAKGE